MFDKLFSMITGAQHLSGITGIFSKLTSIAAELEQGYMQDGNMKDATIDAICQILQQHKSTNQPKQ